MGKTSPSSAEVQAIQDFIAKKGVTHCPTAYVVPIKGATPLEPVPSYDVEFFSMNALEKVHVVRDISWESARFREKLQKAREKKRNRRPRTMLPPGV